MNLMWRANVGFGASRNPYTGSHAVCAGGFDESCNHPFGVDGKVHCSCGKLWSTDTNNCSSLVTDEYVVIFNFFRNLRPIIELFSPDKCYFILEGKPQFRFDLYPEYKANRIIKLASQKEEKDEFFKSAEEIVRLLKYLPITIAKADKYECDDVIGTLCDNLKDEDLTVVSGDTDFIQLLQRNYKSCKVYNPIKKEFMSAPTYPYVAWKCLVGDKSDNITGFSNIGPKKAEKLLADPEKFKKFMEVEENRAQFSIFRKLIEFSSVPEEEILLTEGSSNFPELKKEFERMKFQSLINDQSWEKFQKTFKCIKF